MTTLEKVLIGALILTNYFWWLFFTSFRNTLIKLLKRSGLEPTKDNVRVLNSVSNKNLRKGKPHV